MKRIKYTGTADERHLVENGKEIGVASAANGFTIEVPDEVAAKVLVRGSQWKEVNSTGDDSGSDDSAGADGSTETSAAKKGGK